MFRTVGLVLFLSALLFAADRTGEYAGTFASADGDSQGKIRITIAKSDASGWSCKVSFTHGDDSEVTGKAVTCSLTGDKLVSEFDAEVEGSVFHAKLQGSAAGDDSFEGTYVTASPGGDGDSGKWKVTRR